MPRSSPTRTRPPVVVALLAAVLAVVLAACGSQLAPGEVVGAGGGLSGAEQAGGPVDVAPGLAADPVPGTVGEDGAPGGDGPAAAGAPDAARGGGGSDAPAAGGAEPGGGENAATGGRKAAPCAGFENTTGITDSTITIGNASDISGPVPGIFESAQVAVRAYVAYFNATSDLCGRKLVLKTYDTRTDAGGDQQAHTDACDTVFAMVGSMSAFDSGGASTTQSCGLPDIRSAMVTGARQSCKTCIGAQSTIAGEMNNAVPDYVLKNFPAAAKNAAMLFINAGAAAENGRLQAAAMTKRGMKFSMVRPVDISEFNYAPFVQQMKEEGVRYVQMIGQPAQFVRLAEAMRQQSFKPDVFMIDPSAYDSEYVERGGAAAEGTTVFTNFTPFEEARGNEEMTLYLSRLQQVKPGAEPTFFSVFSWSAARLFVERAAALGGKLSRQTLVREMDEVDRWTANGMHAPQRPGPRRTGECFRFIQLKGGKWVPIGGTKYRCSGTTTVSN